MDRFRFFGMSLPVFRGGGFFLSFRVDFVGVGDHFRFFGMPLPVLSGGDRFSFGSLFRGVWGSLPVFWDGTSGFCVGSFSGLEHISRVWSLTSGLEVRLKLPVMEENGDWTESSALMSISITNFCYVLVYLNRKSGLVLGQILSGILDGSWQDTTRIGASICLT